MFLEYVRVTEKTTGDHHSVPLGEYNANPDAYTLLKQEATDANGGPLPSEPADSKGQTATNQKKEG